MSFSEFLSRSSSFFHFYLHKLISTLVNQILPDSTPNQIDHQIIKSYFIFIFSISIFIGLINLIQFIYPSLFSFHIITTHPNVSGFSLDHQRSIVDIYIDFNHFDFNSTHHSISFLLLQFKSIVHQSLQNSSFSFSKSPTIVYWSYIDRDRLELSDWINQLDLLESHFQHGFVQVINTSQSTIHPSKPTQKPLLDDLLRILNVSPPGRFYVISTSDPDLYGAGIQLVKNHPSSPILAYIQPHGSSLELTELVANVDYLFFWEKDETIRLVKECKSQQNSNLSPTNSERAAQEFEPLNVILKAHSQSLPLEILKDYLRPWCSKASESESDHEDKVIEYIDAAITSGIVLISEQSTLDQDNSTRLIVSRAKTSNPFYLQSECASSVETLSSLPVEKSRLDDDSLTTTGSETSHRSRSGQSSPFNALIESSDHLLRPNRSKSSTTEVAIVGADQITKPESNSTPSEILLKHKHTLDLIENTGRSIKKQKSQQSSITPVPSTFIGSGPSTVRKKGLIKSKSTQSKTIVGGLVSLVQSGSLDQEKHANQSNPVQPVAQDHEITEAQGHHETLIFREGILGLKSRNDDQRTVQKPSLIETTENRCCENKALSNEQQRGPLRLRFSTVWLNCSSGIIINSLSIDQFPDGFQFKTQLFSFTKNQFQNQILGFNINLMNPSNLFDDFSQLEQQVDKNENFSLTHGSNVGILCSHLHFKSFLIPALQDSNLQIQSKLNTNQSTSITPSDLNQVD